jgi:flagellar capping protein FliD
MIREMEERALKKERELDVRLKKIEEFWNQQQATNKYLKPFVVAE